MFRNIALQNVHYYSPYESAKAEVILSLNGTITYIGDIAGAPLGLQHSKIVDCSGKTVLPGFIDLHVNGGGGSDATHGTPEAIENISRGHAMFGTTSLLVAIPGFGDKNVIRCLEAVASRMNIHLNGANILGAHLEGPFVNPQKKGAIPADALSGPSMSTVQTYATVGDGLLRIMTFAPELPGALDLIDGMRELSVIPSLGHTEASYEQATAAIARGATHISHLFNAMSQLNARDPGVVGAAFSGKSCYSELIADGFHVHPAAVVIALNAIGKEHVSLVTDAVEVVGTNRTSFNIPGLNVEVRNGRTWGPNGMLVGSVLTLNTAIKNVAAWTDWALQDILPLATANPASELGIYPKKGAIQVGSDADFAIVDDSFNVHLTIVGGQIVFSRH